MFSNKNKKIKYLLLFPIMIVLFTVLITALLYSKQEEIVQSGLSTFNETIKGKVELAGSHVSPFINFPYISIDLEGLRMFEDKSDSADLILELEDTYLGFNVFSLLAGNIELQKVRLDKGYLKIIQDKNGKINISELLKQDQSESPESDNEEFQLNLKGIELHEIDLLKINEENNLIVEAFVENAFASVGSLDSVLSAKLESEFVFNLIMDGDTSFLHHKDVQLQTAISYDLQTEMLQIQPSEVKIEMALFETQGSINLADDFNLDLIFSGRKQNFDLFMAFAPDELQPVLDRYNNGGQIYFDAIIKGKSINGFSPAINVDFGCREAFVENADVGESVDDLFFEGHFTNGSKRSPETMELLINDFRASPATGVFKGNIKISNFISPEFDIQLLSEFDLDFLSRFLGIRNLENIDGQVSLEMNFHDIIDFEQPEKSIERLNESYYTKLSVKNLNVNSSVYPLKVKGLNIEAEMDGHAALIKKLEGNLGKSDISLTASISDLPAIIHHTDIPVDAVLDIKSKHLDIAELTNYSDSLGTGFNEEIDDFSVKMRLLSSAKAFTESPNLPLGEFIINELHADIKNYPHTLHDFNADVIIDSVDFNVIDFTGMLDDSDFHFNGVLHNYDLWFDENPKGKTSLDFNIYADLIQLDDVFAYGGENYVPQDYRHEEFTDLTLHAFAELNFDQKLVSSTIVVDTLETQMKIHPMKFRDVKGRFYMDSTHVKVTDFSGKLGKSDLLINSTFYLKDSADQMDNLFSLKSKNLDFDELFAYNPPPEGKKMSKEDHESVFNIFEVPFSNTQFSFDLQRLNYHRYKIEEFNLDARMTADHYLYLDTLSLKAAGGSVGLSGYFNGSNPKLIYFSPKAHLQKIDLDQLLFKFENFGQEELVSDNLHGTLTGSLTGKIHVYPDLVPIIDDSEIHLDVNVYNGSLNNYAALEALSDYFSDKNLSNVRFDTLKNQLDIKNGKIMIPKMDINSSLGYFEISGEQAIDMNMEYYISVPLKVVTQAGFSKLFSRKDKNTAERTDEIKNREDYKNSPFLNLKIQGNPDNYKVSLGKRKD